jgi:3-hydroxyisobutyrate dehydrogenase
VAPDELPGPDRVVGFAGLGNMGQPMAVRLAQAGFRVLGYDINAASGQAAAATGLTVADRLDDLAMSCPIVILMLPSSDVVDPVAMALARTPKSRRCRLVVDMSSSEPLRTRDLARALLDEGIDLVDAPVSGGVPGAEAGSLTVMVGGEPDAVERAHAVLGPLAGRIVRTGAVGTGHAAKALNNLLSATTMLATSEALIAAARFGIAAETMLAVLNGSSGRSWSTEMKFPRYVLTRAFSSAFSAALLDKDVTIADGFFDTVELDAPVAQAVVARWHELTALLPSGADHTEIVRPLEDMYGVELTARTAMP